MCKWAIGLLISVLLINQVQAQQVQVAAQQFERYISLLQNKRVALVVNQTSQIDDTHLVDALLAKQVSVVKIFAPEHGFRGDHDAGAYVNNAIDDKTGLPVVSIYGKNKKPAPAQLSDVDVIIFDIQDVGVRFYTYISSMHYMMEAASEQGIQFIVLDRPNPNIAYVDGPVLQPAFRSFVGMHPIPVLHGMTVAELALMIKGEKWINKAEQLALTVIPVAHYTRHTEYSLPIKPSPNLANDQAVALYPSLCFFEATPVSIGRGTDFAFQVIGFSPQKLGDFSFAIRSIKGAAANPKFNGETVYGLDLRTVNRRGLNLDYFIAAYKTLSKEGVEFFQRPEFMDKLAGSDKLRLAIIAGHSAAQIKQSWQPELAAFKRTRAPYLLYQ